MHGAQQVVRQLVCDIKQEVAALLDVEILLLPPFIYLADVAQAVAGTAIQLGAQNLYPGTQGAFTGEVSATMLQDVGCRYVLVGHSERRAIFLEDLTLVAAKFSAAIAAKLIPILCVGETKKERENGETEQVIRKQLDAVLMSAGIDAFRQAVIAYEPVWAIGTGLTATPEQAQSVHRSIRQQLAKNNVDIAETIRILYGGSMNADNAASLLAMPDIDGGLIGGASLDAKRFSAICALAVKKFKFA